MENENELNLRSSRKIVICDDNDDILELLEKVLTAQGYRVGAAHGYLELLPHLTHSRPDLLILDIRMPQMDGFDILEKIQEAGIDVPVFLVTAHDHFMYRNYAPIAGVREYLTKPIDYDLLLGKIDALLIKQ